MNPDSNNISTIFRIRFPFKSNPTLMFDIDDWTPLSDDEGFLRYIISPFDWWTGRGELSLKGLLLAVGILLVIVIQNISD